MKRIYLASISFLCYFPHHFKLCSLLCLADGLLFIHLGRCVFVVHNKACAKCVAKWLKSQATHRPKITVKWLQILTIGGFWWEHCWRHCCCFLGWWGRTRGCRTGAIFFSWRRKRTAAAKQHTNSCKQVTEKCGPQWKDKVWSFPLASLCQPPNWPICYLRRDACLESRF